MQGEDTPDLSELSQAQERTIAALLVSPTFLKAAKKARVTTRSIRRWMKEPAFVAAYESARGKVVEAAIVLIQSAAADALRAMRRVCNDQDRVFGEQFQASTLILQSSLKGIEFGAFNERLAALEKQAKEQGKQ
jgi:hypothetical protein